MIFSSNSQLDHLIVDTIQNAFKRNEKFIHALFWVNENLVKTQNEKPDFSKKLLDFFKFNQVFPNFEQKVYFKTFKLSFFEKLEFKNAFKKALKKHHWEMAKLNDQTYTEFISKLKLYQDKFLQTLDYFYQA